MAGWSGWQTELLDTLGAPHSASNLALLNAWQGCEGGSATFNPLNTTQPGPGATNYNSAGVKNYPDNLTGLVATAATLTNGFYNGIVGDLRRGNVPADQILGRNSAEFATWGTQVSCIAGALGGIGGAPPGVTGPAVPPLPRPSRTSGGRPPGLEGPITFDARAPGPFPFTASAFADFTHALGVVLPHDLARVRKARYAMVRVVR
jgi:hypothetical protein